MVYAFPSVITMEEDSVKGGKRCISYLCTEVLKYIEIQMTSIIEV